MLAYSIAVEKLQDVSKNLILSTRWNITHFFPLHLQEFKYSLYSILKSQFDTITIIIVINTRTVQYDWRF